MFDQVAYGALVRRKRGERKLTQETLALDVFGDSTRKGDISRIENGRITPQEATIVKINIALGISKAEMEPIRQSRPISGQLDKIPTLSREQLEDLAARFGVEGAYDKGDEELRGFLTDKANDYRALRQQIAQLDDHVAEIAELKVKAEAAAEAGDLEEVDNLLAVADVTETAINANTKITRASNALLRNRPEQAFEILSAVADSFRSADPTAPAQLRGQLSKQLYDHGLRYGGLGLQLAEKMLEEAAAALPVNAPAEVSTAVFGNLAVTRSSLAPRLAGHDAANKIGQSAEAFRILLERLPMGDRNWAGTLINFANALDQQAANTHGEGAVKLLAEAITAYRDALTVFTQTDHPVDWAGAQNNLAIALQNQGIRTIGDEGTVLFADAVTAFRAALTVYTEADHPVDWAMTQNNLGAALLVQGNRTAGDAGTALLAKAATAFRAALTFRTEADHPVDWAGTQNNLAVAEHAIANHQATTDPRPHLEAALAHVDAALTVFDPDHMSYDHAKATRLRDHLTSRLEDLS